MTRGRLVIFVALVVVTLALDQGSKAWAHTLPLTPGCDHAGLIAQQCGGVPKPVIDGYWDWELAMNPGAAFSSFIGGQGSRILLSLVAMIALVAIGVSAWRSKPDEGWKRAGLALIAGGALGNLIDRVRDGAVTDFVRWRVHDHRWPIFNLADAALFVGVGFLIIADVVSRRRRKNVAPA
jgi:signal peptidase II